MPTFSAQAQQTADSTTLAAEEGASLIIPGDHVIRDNDLRDLAIIDAIDLTIASAADRLDEEGGEFDRFSSTTEFEYEGVEYEGGSRLTIRNMDGPDGTNLDYSTFGYWVADFDAQGGNPAFSRLTGFALGMATPISEVPTAGSATYLGEMGGLYSEGAGSSVEAKGSLEMTASFGVPSIEGKIVDITAGGENLRDIEFVSSMTVDGTFTGDAVTLAPELDQTGPAMSGAYIGNLFGPTAEEVAGAFVVEGDNAVLVGGFAGAR